MELVVRYLGKEYKAPPYPYQGSYQTTDHCTFVFLHLYYDTQIPNALNLVAWSHDEVIMLLTIFK